MTLRLNFTAVLAALLVMTLCNVLAEEKSPLQVPEGITMPDVGISSHRGSNHSHPENTLPAFREAIRSGAHQIEFDVRFTSCGEIIVIHDATVNRTTNGSGNVADLSFEEIRALDAGSWKHPIFTGVRVPTLDETLKMMPHNIWLNIHTYGGFELGAAVAEKVLEHDRAYQSFIAGTNEVAGGARSVFADIYICNMRRRSDVSRYINETIENGDAFIQLHHRAHEPANAEQLQKLKDAGVRVNFFAANNPEDLQRLFELGIEFVLVDDLHPMMEQAKEIGIAAWKPIYLRNNN